MATKLELEIDYNIGEFVSIKGANNIPIMGSITGRDIHYREVTNEGETRIEQVDTYTIYVSEGHPYNGVYLSVDLIPA